MILVALLHDIHHQERLVMAIFSFLERVFKDWARRLICLYWWRLLTASHIDGGGLNDFALSDLVGHGSGLKITSLETEWLRGVAIAQVHGLIGNGHLRGSD